MSPIRFAGATLPRSWRFSRALGKRDRDAFLKRKRLRVAESNQVTVTQQRRIT